MWPVQERDQCREVVKLLRARIDEVKAAAQVKNDEYWNAELAWREQRTADKVRRDAEWAATKVERDVAYKARMAELAGEPFNQEVRRSTSETLRGDQYLGTAHILREPCSWQNPVL